MRTLTLATGAAKWIVAPDAQMAGGVLTINGTPYLVFAVRLKRHENPERPIVGWKLTKADGTVYDLRLQDEVPSCDCGNYVFARDRAETLEFRACKHIRGLKAALASLEVNQ